MAEAGAGEHGHFARPVFLAFRTAERADAAAFGEGHAGGEFGIGIVRQRLFNKIAVHPAGAQMRRHRPARSPGAGEGARAGAGGAAASDTAAAIMIQANNSERDIPYDPTNLLMLKDGRF